MTPQIPQSSISGKLHSIEPDFIIAGAMKCGTTWLHHALHALESIKIPEGEMHIADFLDPVSHPDFFTTRKNTLVVRELSNTSWYHDALSIKQSYPDHIIGWDSTTLFHSHLDISAIAQQYPNTKLIILLRDPTKRAYSHYWHMVRTGRCSSSFEKAILKHENQLLHRSFYRDQALKFADAFQSRVRILLYEEMFQNPHTVFGDILNHIGLNTSYEQSLEASLGSRQNKAMYPNFLTGWLLASQLLAGLETSRYNAELTGPSGTGKFNVGLLYKAKLAAMVCAGFGFSYEPTPKYRISKDTKQFLDNYLSEANYGLEDIIGLDINKYWYT